MGKLLLLITTILCASSISGADPNKNGKSAKGKTERIDDKLDITDIEKKYWAPKDTDFSVVQNRSYTKEKRFSISLGYGPQVNDGFTEGYSTGITGNYFFSERHGIQIDYISSNYSNSNATEGFIGQGGSPNYGKVSGYYGVGYNWIPFYAKMSVIGKKIIYFDMSFTPLLGMTQYDAITRTKPVDKSSLTYGFEVSQWFFISSHFAVRVDLRQTWYNEEILQNYGSSGSGNPVTGTKLRDHFQDNTLLLFGGTFFF
ncbi:MAG: outer membrane beta-barrel domain-containing protein [Bdellovibrionales bacterium]|nr:outer membrane beta-barrel domain-containing protein [Bdellovibrionales bacterium]